MAQEAKSFSMSQEEFSCFKGYPYLVVRIMTALYHINLMTAERSSLDWLCNIAQAQANANKFEVCLVLNAHVGVYFSSRHKPYSSEVIPRGGIAITDRLRLCVDQPSGEDFLRRGKDLEVFIENNSPKSGFLLGDLKKGGREATQEELISLQGVQENGLPKGITICPTCGDYRGECLDKCSYTEGLVVRVSCYCDNDNLCAYCGGKLNSRKLNANYYNPEDKKIWHVPSFSGLSHRCPDAPRNI